VFKARANLVDLLAISEAFHGSIVAEQIARILLQSSMIRGLQVNWRSLAITLVEMPNRETLIAFLAHVLD